MSWKDRLQNTVFTITTGDGKVFTPLWKNGETSKEFNASVFEFINLPGSLIDRKQVKARSFPLVFWFQGDDNIDQAEQFDQSANDPRAWSVGHPFYGTVTGQPLSISRNDSNYNVTEISVDFWETITDNLPKKQASITESTLGKSNEIASASSIEYSSKINLAPADVSMIRDNAQKINLNVSALLDSKTYSDYQLAKNGMFAKIDNMIAEPATAIQGINELIRVPAQFSIGVSSRINLLKALYEDAKGILGLKNSRNNKSYFEAAGAAVISSFSTALVNPLPGDYIIRKDIEAGSAALSSIYLDYLYVMDSAYVPSTDPINSFSASPSTQSGVQEIVIETISSLNSLAFDAKQERNMILEKESNLIVLTHKYMGLDPEDKNIEQFRAINNIKNKSLFLLKKGRQIKYLV